MLTKTKMQEIQDLKLQGYTKADIIRYYEAQGRKPPSRPTISKYYDMDVIPDDPGAKWIYRCAESACPVFWKSHIRLSEITLNQLNYPLFYETWLIKALPPLAVLAALINQGT